MARVRANARDIGRIKSTARTNDFRKLLRRFPNRVSIVAEGDSWFAYPRKWLWAGKPNNVITQLKYMRRFNLLTLASNGDEAVSMVTGASKFRLLKIIHEFTPNFLMFSGGGNDIVGKYDFDFFLNAGVSSSNWKDYVNLKRLNRRLDQIAAAYEDLVEYCREYSPATKVVTHCYDYAVPDPQGAELFGGLLKIDDATSWIYPYLRQEKVDASFDQTIVDYFIDQLAAKQIDLQSRHPGRVIFVDTRNTVDPDTEWLNEIHPNPAGFKKVATAIYKAMEPHFA